MTSALKRLFLGVTITHSTLAQQKETCPLFASLLLCLSFGTSTCTGRKDARVQKTKKERNKPGPGVRRCSGGLGSKERLIRPPKAFNASLPRWRTSSCANVRAARNGTCIEEIQGARVHGGKNTRNHKLCLESFMRVPGEQALACARVRRSVVASISCREMGAIALRGDPAATGGV